MKQLEYQQQNAELQILEKKEEIELLTEAMAKYAEEIQLLEGDLNE